MSGKRKEERGKRERGKRKADRGQRTEDRGKRKKERGKQKEARGKQREARKEEGTKCQGERTRKLADNVLLPSASLIFCKSRSFFVRSEGGTSTGTLITESWSNV
jgi:hypothetical protein